MGRCRHQASSRWHCRSCSRSRGARARHAQGGMTSSAPNAKHELTVRVPWVLRKRGGRKLVVAPDGTALAAPQPRVDSTVVKAIARAHRWKRMLETGPYTSVRDLAAAEKINESYLARVLRLTLLAPDIIEAILDGRQPAADLQLEVLLKPVPIVWEEQRCRLR